MIILNTLSHKDKIKRIEIKLAAFFAEHTVAFNTVDHLIPLLKDIYINPKIVQDFSADLSTQILSKMLSRNVKSKKLLLTYELVNFQF